MADVTHFSKKGFFMSKVIPTNEEYIYEGKVAISQTDLNDNITFVNRKFCEISGYSSEELINSSHSIVKHPDMPHEIFVKMHQALKSGQVWNGLLKNMRKDGSFYWVNSEIVPIHDNQGEISGYISVSKPVPRKNIEEYNINQTNKTV